MTKTEEYCVAKNEAPGSRRPWGLWRKGVLISTHYTRAAAIAARASLAGAA